MPTGCSAVSPHGRAARRHHCIARGSYAGRRRCSRVRTNAGCRWDRRVGCSGSIPTRLRRWADEGRVEAWTTPGGHRRFDRRALERLATDRRRGVGRPLASMGASPERLNRVYRRHYAADAAATEAIDGPRLLSPTTTSSARRSARTAAA